MNLMYLKVFYTEYLYKDLNVLPVQKLFFKTSVLYIIKNNLTSILEHKYYIDIIIKRFSRYFCYILCCR